RKTFYLSTSPSNTGTSSLINHGWYLSPTQTIDVETLSLDDYARARGIQDIKLAKVDVERAESEVLRGMAWLLNERRIEYLIVEMYSNSEAHRAVAERGYGCYWIDLERRRFIEAGSMETGCFGDYLLVSPKRLTEFRQRFRSCFAQDQA